jgi:hypothetical protein
MRVAGIRRGADTYMRPHCVSCKSWLLVKVHFPPRGTARAQPHTAALFQSSSSEDCGVTCAQAALYISGVREFDLHLRGAVAENFGQFQAKRVKWPDRASHTVKDPDSDEPPPLDRFHWPSAIYALFSVIRSPRSLGCGEMNGREPLRLSCCRIFMENQQPEWQDRARRCPHRQKHTHKTRTRSVFWVFERWLILIICLCAAPGSFFLLCHFQ